MREIGIGDDQPNEWLQKLLSPKIIDIFLNIFNPPHSMLSAVEVGTKIHLSRGCHFSLTVVGREGFDMSFIGGNKHLYCLRPSEMIDGILNGINDISSKH